MWQGVFSFFVFISLSTAECYFLIIWQYCLVSHYHKHRSSMEYGARLRNGVCSEQFDQEKPPFFLLTVNSNSPHPKLRVGHKKHNLEKKKTHSYPKGSHNVCRIDMSAYRSEQVNCMYVTLLQSILYFI